MNMKLLTIISLMIIILTMSVISASDEVNACAGVDNENNNLIKNQNHENLVESFEDNNLGSDIVSLEFVNNNISDSEDYVLSVYDSSKIKGNISIFANNSHVYSKEFKATNEVMLISAKDLFGSFNGTYLINAVYKKTDGGEYIRNSTVNYLTPIVHYKLNPELFNVTFLNKEVDINNVNSTVIRFFCPNNVYEYNSSIKIRYGVGDFDFKVHKLTYEDYNTYKFITVSDLFIPKEGIYNLSFSYNIGINCIFEINSTLKVTKSYTPDDFIDLFEGEINNSDDCLCIIHDSSKSGINGSITIYANNTQVYSKFITQTDIISISPKELNAYLNGNYNIGVSYFRWDRIEYFKNRIVKFNNINPTTANKTDKKSDIIILKLKNTVIKKSAKKITLQVSLKINGKVAAKKQVRFKFLTKTYKAKTNSKGIAKVVIKKNVLKKLKKGKKITYSATYSIKTVKKTVKVRK